MKSIVPLPTRDSFGGYSGSGKSIALRANFFPVRIDYQTRIHHYDISVVDRLERELPKKLTEEIIKEFTRKYKHVLFRDIAVATDFRKNLFLSDRIPEKMIKLRERKKFSLEYKKHGGARAEEFTVSLRYAAELNPQVIEKVLNGGGDINDPMYLTVVQALDIVAMHGFKMNDAFTSVGRNFFLKQQPRAFELGQGKEIWFGFHQSLRPCQKSMMLNIDVAATTFYKGQPLVDFCAQILFPLPKARRDGPKPVQRPMPATINDKQRRQLEKALKDVKVETRHTEYTRQHKICKVPQTTARTHSFTDGNNNKITVAKYFESAYKLRLSFPNLPLVLMNPKEKNIYMPMELCYVKSAEHYRKKLDPDATAQMVRACAKPAPERQKTIEHYARKNNYGHDQTLNGFNVQVSSNMTQVEGRVLPPRQMITQGRTETPEKGVWQSKVFHEPIKVTRWAIYCSESEKYCSNQKIKAFVDKLQRGARQYGIELPPPCLSHYLKEPHHCERAVQDSIKRKCQLMFLLLGGRNGTPFYNKVKQMGDVFCGIPTQCMQAKNIDKANSQFIGNMLLKINAKLNGVNNVCRSDPKIPGGNNLCLKKPTMIIGADVTHPAPGDVTRPSIAALVASLNADCTKYCTQIRVQAHRQEMIGSMDPVKKQHLKDMFVECLNKFYQQTNQKPLHIIYYRDGVSEGQFNEVYHTELKQLRAACSMMPGNYRPKMTIVIAQKRHHARLFCNNPRDAVGSSKNIPAGTLVDRTITHPTQFDFYLCSHAGIQGTSRPTHYHVIYNDEPSMKDGPDVLQSLTYSLCHVYQRCQRSVSLPAPVYYAHLAAYRATVHLKEDEDDSSVMSDGSGSRQLSEGGAGRLQSKVELHENLSNNYQHFI